MEIDNIGINTIPAPLGITTSWLLLSFGISTILFVFRNLMSGFNAIRTKKTKRNGKKMLKKSVILNKY